MSVLREIRLRDALVVAGLFVLALLADSVNRSALPDFDDAVPLMDIVLIAVVVAPLLVRRAFPLVTLMVVTVAYLVAAVVEVPESTILTLALFVALFSAGAYGTHPARDLLRAITIVASMGVVLFFLFVDSRDVPGDIVLFRVFSLALNVAFFGAAWVMGDLWRKRAEDEAELARRAGALERQRHLLAEQAVADERLRIARELHDVVGHHVSVMGVQAGAARRLLGVDGDRTRELLASTEASGRDAVAEMGRLVGFLRAPGEDAIAPQPTMDGLDDLVVAMTDAGLSVDVHRVGKPRPLTSATDLSVYRVLQESLTNALRHGARPEARVEITYLTDALSVRIRNPAGAQQGNGNRSEPGRGLMGMKERAALVHGSLEAGRGADGMFEVRGTFPYGVTE
jgi:signal transduction histidine kinase